jgi:hypothetical protein
MRTSHRTSKSHQTPTPPDGRKAAPEIPECLQVFVQCRDEQQQRELYERMTAEGFKCRVLVL